MPSKEPILDELDSFMAPLDRPALPVLDRSTLERWATCPAQAAIVEANLVNNDSDIAAAGTEVHAALGETLREYVASRGALGPQDLRQGVENWLLASRPDVQPDVLRAFRRSVWDWSKLVSGIHHDNLLRFDGGEGVRSGQLAWEVAGTCTVTSEIDLLYTSASPGLLEEIDYKTGHKLYTHDDVRDSFQFGLHAFLVFKNYPKVDALRVRVWNTRVNQLTWPVTFLREHLDQQAARISSATRVWWEHGAGDPMQAPAWPSAEKCPGCVAVTRCPIAVISDVQPSAEPAVFLASLSILDGVVKEMKSTANKYVRTHGDLVDETTGFAYGSGAKSSRVTNKLYKLGGADDE